MTTLYRVLVILVVAFMIGGVMFAAVGGNGTSNPSAQAGDLPREGHDRPDGHDEGREGGGGLPLGWIKSLVLMSVGAGVFLGMGRLASLIKSKPVLS